MNPLSPRRMCLHLPFLGVAEHLVDRRDRDAVVDHHAHLVRDDLHRAAWDHAHHAAAFGCLAESFQAVREYAGLFWYRLRR
jgi:hypothetical protein